MTNATQTDFQRFTTPTERRIANRLIADALAQGLTVSVHDGEEWALKRGETAAEIRAALASTGADTLAFRDMHGASLGWVSLVWGNGCDLISDHRDTPDTHALVAGASALAESLDR